MPCAIAVTTRVYPRVCGGTPVDGAVQEKVMGLSPRVRGNLGAPRPAVPPPRSIPACAGEPRPALVPASSLEVYPRVCGGTPQTEQYIATMPGLSPRVRGNLGVLRPKTLPPGSIPACAGEPPSPEREPRTGRVYPRVCGGTQRAAERGA